MRFENRRVIVTGAASGIGLATARAFAMEGARVVGVDMNAKAAGTASDGLGSVAERVTYEVADLSTADACHRVVEAAVAPLGGLDVLVNVAGFAQLGHFLDVTEGQFQKMVAVNMGATFFMTQASMPHLLTSGGNVVSVASVAGLTGNPYNSTYCATKGAIVNLTRALAVEYSQRGVRVNCICPGSVLTEATRNTVIPEDTDPELFRVMLPPLGHCKPTDIAEGILYLASDAARYVTGTALAVDGGRSAV